MSQQSIGEIVQIKKALAQIGITDLHHASAGVVADLLHCRFGGQPAADRIGDSCHPTAVGGEHAISFNDIVMFADAKLAAGRDEVIDRFAHYRDCATQSHELGVDVFSDNLTDDDPRLVQNRRPDSKAAIEADSDQAQGEHPAARALRDLKWVDEIAAGGKFSDDHGDRLKNLDLVLGVVAQGAVLNDEHTQHSAAAQDRHAHQRMEDFFPRLRPVRKVRVRLRIGERERSRCRSDYPNEALAHSQPCPMNRFRPQPLSGEELEDLPGAHDIGRAYLRHHLGGDDADNPVEPLLGGPGAGHDIAKAAQKTAGTTDACCGFCHSRASWLRNSLCGGRTVACCVLSKRAARTPSAWSTSSSRISAVACSRVTKPTLWPAINDPDSMSPSITARRSAPAQKCSISNCASFCDSSPRANRLIA